jgi:hypothetical protein
MKNGKPNAYTPSQVALKLQKTPDLTEIHNIEFFHRQDVAGIQPCGDRIQARVISDPSGLGQGIIVMRQANDFDDIVHEIKTEADVREAFSACVKEVICLYKTYGYLYFDGKSANFLMECMYSSSSSQGKKYAIIADYGGCAPESVSPIGVSQTYGTYPPAWLLPKRIPGDVTWPFNTVPNTIYWMGILLLQIAQVKIRQADGTYSDADLSLSYKREMYEAIDAYSKIFNDDCKPRLSPACKRILEYCSRYRRATNSFDEKSPFFRSRVVTFEELEGLISSWNDEGTFGESAAEAARRAAEAEAARRAAEAEAARRAAEAEAARRAAEAEAARRAAEAEAARRAAEAEAARRAAEAEAARRAAEAEAEAERRASDFSSIPTFIPRTNSNGAPENEYERLARILNPLDPALVHPPVRNLIDRLNTSNIRDILIFRGANKVLEARGKFKLGAFEVKNSHKDLFMFLKQLMEYNRNAPKGGIFSLRVESLDLSENAFDDNHFIILCHFFETGLAGVVNLSLEYNNLTNASVRRVIAMFSKPIETGVEYISFRYNNIDADGLQAVLDFCTSSHSRGRRIPKLRFSDTSDSRYNRLNEAIKKFTQ